MAPEFPELVVPVLNTNAPLTPAAPAFAVRMLTMPDVVAVPSPEPILRSPPVCTVLRPLYASKNPPDPLVPLPDTIKMEPLRPAVAAPVPRISDPELPEDVVPVLNTSAPLAPDTPALALRMLTIPELVAVPSPESKLTLPPV